MLWVENGLLHLLHVNLVRPDFIYYSLFDLEDYTRKNGKRKKKDRERKTILADISISQEQPREGIVYCSLWDENFEISTSCAQDRRSPPELIPVHKIKSPQGELNSSLKIEILRFYR